MSVDKLPPARPYTFLRERMEKLWHAPELFIFVLVVLFVVVAALAARFSEGSFG
jgi:hypothetical protein